MAATYSLGRRRSGRPTSCAAKKRRGAVCLSCRAAGASLTEISPNSISTVVERRTLNFGTRIQTLSRIASGLSRGRLSGAGSCAGRVAGSGTAAGIATGRSLGTTCSDSSAANTSRLTATSAISTTAAEASSEGLKS